jgi:hypothetical protein
MPVTPHDSSRCHHHHHHRAVGERKGGGKQLEFAWNREDGTLGLHFVGRDPGLCSVLARPEDPFFLTWMLRRGRVVLNRVLVQDMVEMWSRMTVVRTIPFLGGFLGLLHYLVLLVLRAAVWDSHTAHRAILVLCCSVGCYCIYFYPSMRLATRRRSVVLLSLMYHVQPFVSCVINAQVLCAHHTPAVPHASQW